MTAPKQCLQAQLKQWQRHTNILYTSTDNIHLIKGPHGVNLWFDFALSVEIQDRLKTRAYKMWLINELSKAIPTNCAILVDHSQRIETFSCKIRPHQFPVAFLLA